MEQVISSVEARKTFSKLLREVETLRKSYVVERNGERVAAVVPFDVYERWKQSRKDFFLQLDSIAARADVPEDEAMELALEAQRWARNQK